MERFISYKDSFKRLEDLKQETIIRYADKIDFEDEFTFYESILRHLFAGDFDNEFYAPALEEVSVAEREKIMELACKYGFLCLYEGNFELWEESCEGTWRYDIEELTSKIVDNFYFLVELIKDTGSLCLTDLKELTNTELAERGSIIEVLRNTFRDDIALEMCLEEMSKENSIYKDLDINAKKDLLDAPKGVLYYLDESNEVHLVPEEDLVSRIKEYQENNPDIFFSLDGDSLKELSEGNDFWKVTAEIDDYYETHGFSNYHNKSGKTK